MSVLQKGLMTVVGVTAFVSVLILLTGKNATAESDSSSPKKTTNAVSESLNSTMPKATLDTPQNKISSKNSQGNDGLRNSLNKPLLYVSPPPIGPFQAARPKGFSFQRQTSASSKKPSMKQRAPTVAVMPNQSIKAPVTPIVKTMNQQAPQPPKEMGNQPLKPTLEAKKVKVPVNRLVKPEAPVQKTPEIFSTPPAAPIMQRYMYVPVPAQMYQKVPKVPMKGIHAATSNKAAVENEHNNSGALHKNKQQPNK